MALREEDVFQGAGAVVYRFPSERVRAVSVRLGLARHVSVVLVALGIVGLVVLGGGPRGSATASRPGAPRAVVVAEGQTLWEIASRYAPDAVDRRAYVDAILELNGLESPPPAGSRLKLPR